MSEPVLERNVRLLVRRSYVPALPAPHFRDRLESLFIAEAARRGRRLAPHRGDLGGDLLWGAFRPRVARFAVALAAVLVAVLLGWRLLPDGAAPARAELLARGAVALGLPDGAWRAASEVERVHGLVFAPPALTAATPASVEFDLLLGAGRVHLAEHSEVALLQTGDIVTATLRAGAAWFLSGATRSDLVRDVPLSLEAAPAVPASALAGGARPAVEREEIEPTHPPVAPPAVAAPARVLTGQVVVAESGAPAGEFTVALLRELINNEPHPPALQSFTSSDGRFAWTDPPAGKQRVFVHAPGFALCALGEHDLSGALPELRAELASGSSVTGIVEDAEGNPVADALVISEHDAPTDWLFFHGSERAFWLPIQTRSGPDGRFELAHLSSSLHTLRASADGHAPSWRQGVRVPRTVSEPLVLTLPEGGTIEGTVTRPDGGPGAGAEIVAVAMGQTQVPRTNFAHTVTDPDGRYRFEHLPPTTMIVVLVGEDERPQVRPVQVDGGATMRVDFGAPVRGVQLTGRLLARDGTPVGNQNLALFEESAKWHEDWIASTTNPDGSYVFPPVKAGPYMIFLIDKMGRGVRGVDEIVLPPGASAVEHDVRIRGGALEVHVGTAESGDPAPETALMLIHEKPDGDADFSAFLMSDAEGRARFIDLRPGTYHVIAYPTQNGLGFGTSTPVVIAEDGAGETEVLLEAGGAVDVLVRDPDGKPLEGATVLFRDELDDEHSFSSVPLTDAQGRYHANGLRPGSYRVVAQLPGYGGTPVPFRFELGRELEIPVLLTPLPPR